MFYQIMNFDINLFDTQTYLEGMDRKVSYPTSAERDSMKTEGGIEPRTSAYRANARPTELSNLGSCGHTFF